MSYTHLETETSQRNFTGFLDTVVNLLHWPFKFTDDSVMQSTYNSSSKGGQILGYM